MATVFFRQFNAIGPLFCSIVQQHQLELRTSKTYSKRQKLVQNKNIDVQNLENIEYPLGVFHSDFFPHFATFFRCFFWIQPEGLPFVCFSILQHNGCQKIPKGPPFTFFGTVTLIKNLIFDFFSKIFQNLIDFGPPLIFFIVCNQLGFHKAQRVSTFTILSLRYSADFGRSRIVSS